VGEHSTQLEIASRGKGAESAKGNLRAGSFESDLIFSLFTYFFIRSTTTTTRVQDCFCCLPYRFPFSRSCCLLGFAPHPFLNLSSCFLELHSCVTCLVQIKETRLQFFMFSFLEPCGRELVLRTTPRLLGGRWSENLFVLG
jgi:hypothetical protein